MRYPCLVPKKLCRTEIRLELEHEGLNEYGEPFEPICYSGKCNYQDKAKTILKIGRASCRERVLRLV